MVFRDCSQLISTGLGPLLCVCVCLSLCVCVWMCVSVCVSLGRFLEVKLLGETEFREEFHELILKLSWQKKALSLTTNTLKKKKER